jgi:hypothetical protein
MRRRRRRKEEEKRGERGGVSTRPAPAGNRAGEVYSCIENKMWFTQDSVY